jgi:two-component system, OmpR family, response regulator TctD
MRLLLVEDNPELAKWLATALTQAGYAVDAVADGVAADATLSTTQYDVVVLDRLLPRMDGLTVLKRLRERQSNVPVLMLTALTDLNERIRGMDEGADDYLGKPFALSELEARLRSLLRRAHGHTAPSIDCGPLRLDSVARSFTLNGQLLALTPREHAVLEALLLRSGRAVSKEALFEQVFNFDSSAGIETIEIYVHRLRKKLDVPGIAIVTLRGLGYVLEARATDA